MHTTIHKRLYRIAVRELRHIATRPIYLFCMVIAPVFCYVFFTTLMANGLPTNMPAGVVDMDNTATTRSIIRNLDAFQQTHVTARYANFHEARKAVQRGELFITYPKAPPRKPSPEGSPACRFTSITRTSSQGRCCTATSARCRNLLRVPLGRARF